MLLERVVLMHYEKEHKRREVIDAFHDDNRRMMGGNENE